MEHNGGVSVPESSSPVRAQAYAQGHQRPGARPWAWLIALVLMAVAFFSVYWGFVTTSKGQVLEYASLQAAQERIPDIHSVLLQMLSYLPQVVGVVAVAAFILLTVFRRRWLASLLAALTFGAANLTSQLLKTLLERPYFDNAVPYYTGNSLPSGHTTFAAAAMVAVFLVVAPRWRPATAFGGALFAVLVGVATYIEAWHRPADMVAAFLVSGFWGLIGGLAIFRTGANWNMLAQRTKRYPWPSGNPTWDVLLWVLGGGLLVGAFLMLLPLGSDALSSTYTVVEDTFPSSWYVAYGALFSAGGGFLVFGFLSTFFRWEAGRKR